MASPIAHSLTGFALYSIWRVKNEPRGQSRPDWRTAGVFALLANLADFDFIVSWIFKGDPNVWHHAWSHGIFAAAVMTLLAVCVFRLPGGRLASTPVFFALIGSHVVIDFFTGPDLGFKPAWPIPLLAPFSPAEFRAPVTLFPGIEHRHGGDILSLHNAFCALYESALFAPLALGLWFAMQPRPRAAAGQS
jgi:inner membrane protein